MVTNASITTEGHQIWTRPLEVGFTMGEYVIEESTTTKLLGILRISGDSVNGGISMPTFGQTSGLSPNGQYAVNKVVEKQKADGMYLLYTEDQNVTTGLTVMKKSIIKGYVLHFKVYGPIDDETMKMIRMGNIPNSDENSPNKMIEEQENNGTSTNSNSNTDDFNTKIKNNKRLTFTQLYPILRESLLREKDICDDYIVVEDTDINPSFFSVRTFDDSVTLSSWSWDLKNSPLVFEDLDKDGLLDYTIELYNQGDGCGGNDVQLEKWTLFGANPKKFKKMQ